MTLLKILPAGVLAAGVFATSAWAQAPQNVPLDSQPVPEAAKPPPQSPAAPTSPGAVIFKYEFEKLDKNRDGYLSRDEVADAPELAKDFDRFDRNRDGKLDRSEFEAFSK